MKKALIFCIIILVFVITSNAQTPSYYTLATDNGVYLSGDNGKVKNNMTSISFSLSANQTYSLKFQGEDKVEFAVNGTTFTGFINRILIETGDKPETLVMFIKGKGNYSYALGLQ